tara:strand:- start:787 stop:951 length:165 start_codon:yes stop_codon:yes gene_type:complete
VVHNLGVMENVVKQIVLIQKKDLLMGVGVRILEQNVIVKIVKIIVRMDQIVPKF